MIRPSFANEVRTTLTDGRTDGRTDRRTRDGRTDGRGLADMRRTGVGKPRPLLDQEKLDLFRGKTIQDHARDASRKGHDSIIVAKKFDQLVAALERKMRAALHCLKEMLKGLD
ncbi:hypothetical protein DPMN_075287 [Dreissena polymorpha]|uniref:Uncharacterized protein n=1 Tax=Dreissena polymorpha TaxID=45954 RepID=A0A9D3YGI3_DREPO|nr:hypothetical protein DPMN_075287 [Dreissena polymorpha]